MFGLSLLELLLGMPRLLRPAIFGTCGRDCYGGVSPDRAVNDSDINEWSTVRGRRVRRVADGESRPGRLGPFRTPRASRSGARSVSSGARVGVGPGRSRPADNRPGVRLPKAVAVSIRATNNSVSYADIMKKTKSSFALTDLGINSSRIREAANGGMLIEVFGSNGASKADVLDEKLKEVLGESAVVARPVVKWVRSWLSALTFGFQRGDTLCHCDFWWLQCRGGSCWTY